MNPDNPNFRTAEDWEDRYNALRAEYKILQKLAARQDRNISILSALKVLESEDWFWDKKPYINESGKEHPGYMKNIATIQSFVKEIFSKVMGVK